MTGDKPDERLRTPMHWTCSKAAGFTTAARESLAANGRPYTRWPG